MSDELLTRSECNALRGLAITGIFLHNYCHWLGPVVKENEYQYFQHNVDWLAQVSASIDALYPAHLISFFGHYGVPIFLFLSAYGLERKYGASPTPQDEGETGDGRNNVLQGRPLWPSATDNSATGGHKGRPCKAYGSPQSGALLFLRRHFLKLFRMMIVGFVCFTVVDAITPGSWHYTVGQIVGQLLMVNNLFPQPDHNIWPGPFWFFGLMLQLYAVYRLLLYRRHWGWTVALMVVCTAVQLFLAPEGEALNRWRYNFMGGMLPFGLGLLFARYGEKIMLVRMNSGSLLMCWVVTSLLIVSASETFYTWTLVPALVCYASVYFVKVVGKGREERGKRREERDMQQDVGKGNPFTLPSPLSTLYSFLEWMGGISAALFIIHPTLRKVFIPISRHGDVYTGILLYTVASIAAACLIHASLKKKS